jgi:hypothetical protein
VFPRFFSTSRGGSRRIRSSAALNAIAHRRG